MLITFGGYHLHPGLESLYRCPPRLVNEKTQKAMELIGTLLFLSLAAALATAGPTKRDYTPVETLQVTRFSLYLDLANPFDYKLESVSMSIVKEHPENAKERVPVTCNTPNGQAIQQGSVVPCDGDGEIKWSIPQIMAGGNTLQLFLAHRMTDDKDL